MKQKIFAVALIFLACTALPGPAGAESGLQKQKRTPPGLAKKGGIPPGHAKRGCLPPGLAKKYGKKAPCAAYVLVDPQKPTQAWFLVGQEWVLRVGFEASVREEIKAALRVEIAPPPPPPIPLPRVEARLEILLFGD